MVVGVAERGRRGERRQAWALKRLRGGGAAERGGGATERRGEWCPRGGLHFLAIARGAERKRTVSGCGELCA